MTKERLKEILIAYIRDDEQNIADSLFIYEKLRDVCGCTMEEIEELGFDYDDPDGYEDPALELGFDPYMGCYSDDC